MSDRDDRDDQQPTSTRERILAAAAAILGKGGVTARLSVRTVAARAGVSVGSLRHHFPAQQDLRDEVMRRVYDWMLPDVSIHDTTVPARDRLVRCLRQVLEMTGTGPDARATLVQLTRSFIDVDQTASVREAYLAVHRDGQRRMEQWLRVLAEEGALDEEDIGPRALLLDAVLGGLSLNRALPAQDSLPQREAEALQAAVDAVLTFRDPHAGEEHG